MAPEQLETTSDRQSSPATDIYSIGIVFLEMLSGKIHENPDTSRITHIGIPPTIEQVINRAISKDPVERFQTADDMARSLTLIA
jgi:serine/threonine protein kinase